MLGSPLWSLGLFAAGGLLTDEEFTELDLEHPVFHTSNDIDQIDLSKSSGQAAILGLVRDDRLRIIFSPMGLNDTANAGDDCCCCGGNEIENARQINANTVAYVLTH
jgi:hypothetical protein